MMATINQVVLKGNITFDAEVKKVGSGISLCKLPLAVTNYVKKKGQEKPEAEPCYIDVVCWGETADRVGTLKRGDEIIVSGRLKMETWQDKQTGANRSKHVILPTCVEATKFLGETAPIQQPTVQNNQQQQQNTVPNNHGGFNERKPLIDSNSGNGYGSNNNNGGYGGF